MQFFEDPRLLVLRMKYKSKFRRPPLTAHFLGKRAAHQIAAYMASGVDLESIAQWLGAPDSYRLREHLKTFGIDVRAIEQSLQARRRAALEDCQHFSTPPPSEGHSQPTNMFVNWRLKGLGYSIAPSCYRKFIPHRLS